MEGSLQRFLMSSPSANKHCAILVSDRSISKIFSSETAWLNKAKFYRSHNLPLVLPTIYELIWPHDLENIFYLTNNEK
jgi:hypothetical protein